MIATIAIVTLAASATANPVVMTQGLGVGLGLGDDAQGASSSFAMGRKLIGYTQSLGEPCDVVSYCKSDLKCTNGVFGTGKCVQGESFGTKIASTAHKVLASLALDISVTPV
jgi:hypothetical protein